VRDIGGRPQLVFSGSKGIVSLDPRDGSPVWSIDGPTEQFVASLVCDGRQFFMAAGFPTYHLMSITPTGRGNVTDTHVAWHVTKISCYVPSPVVVDGYLLVAEDQGTAACFDTADGSRHWHARLGSHYSASLITGTGLVYFTADDGITKVVRPARQLEVLAENPLGEACYSSAAVSKGQILLRAEKNLYCIGTAE
jgi:hypothetical protein